jgi:hypothetical protein
MLKQNSEVNKQEKKDHVTQRFTDAVATEVREIGSVLD